MLLEAAVVLGIELGEEADLDIAAEFGAVAAEILVEEDAFDGGAGDSAGLSFDVGPEEEEGRPGLLIDDGDEEDGTGAGGAGRNDLGGVGEGGRVIGVLVRVWDGAGLGGLVR